DIDADLGFAGLWKHRASGLDLGTYRAYDALRGRWLNRDPVGEAGGVNLYEYGGGNPLSRIDPSGLKMYPDDFMGPLPPDGYHKSQMTKTRCGLVPPSPPGA